MVRTTVPDEFAMRMVTLSLGAVDSQKSSGCSVRRVLASDGIFDGRPDRLDRAESVRRARREEMRRLCRHVGRQLAERRYVVQDPEAATVRGDHQVAEVLLHGDPVDRRVRQVVLQRLPVSRRR